MTVQTARPNLLTTQNLSDYTGVPVRTLDRWRQTNEGPPFVALGRHVRYPEDALLAWMRDQMNGSAS